MPAEKDSGELTVTFPTEPLPFTYIMPLVMFVTASEVVVAFVEKRLPAVSAVEDAYGNCDAATVDDAKNTPCVEMDVVVALVEVPYVLNDENGNANVEAT